MSDTRSILFVEKQFQRDGIGTILIKHCKNLYDKLSLKVYKKNEGAISFYQAMGFENVLGQVDEKTNELEYIMEWNKQGYLVKQVLYFQELFQQLKLDLIQHMEK